MTAVIAVPASAAVKPEANPKPGLANRLAGSAVGTAPKAWRFVGEMEEIAAAFERHDLPTGFHRGAADLYEMLAVFRDEAPSFDEVAELLSGRRAALSRLQLSIRASRPRRRTPASCSRATSGPMSTSRSNGRA